MPLINNSRLTAGQMEGSLSSCWSFALESWSEDGTGLCRERYLFQVLKRDMNIIVTKESIKPPTSFVFHYLDPATHESRRSQ